MKGGPLARLAGQLCQQPEFWDFAGGAESAEEAAQWVRRTCGVKSRAELDTNPDAAYRFHNLVRIPFAYREYA